MQKNDAIKDIRCGTLLNILWQNVLAAGAIHQPPRQERDNQPKKDAMKRMKQANVFYRRYKTCFKHFTLKHEVTASFKNHT